jgi:hypothetical protein
MDILEMHQMFRVIGQQMGLERVRGILEESIDVYLNAAIQETVSNVIKSNVQTVYKDKITIQDNPISPVNGVSTLYRESSFRVDSQSELDITLTISDVLLLYAFSISYPGETTYKDCRFIEPDRIGATLNDYCSRASKQYPIITVVSVDEKNNRYIFRVFTGGSNYENIKVKYIKTPAVVSLEENVSCDLPQHLHKDIVEIAVQKYLTSVGSTTQRVQ